MAPTLSILIPAYNYAAGVTRILATLSARIRDDVEVIVSDDSPGDDVAQAVFPFASVTGIRYVHNTPPLGAATNWNTLLDAARGEYCLLLHHDECPTSPTFVEDVLRELSSHSRPDALVLNCLVARGAAQRLHAHTPTWLRSAVLRHAPSYLLFRNVIGPPSVIVAKRAIYPRFDEHLAWFIDVDAYMRLRATTSSIHIAPKLAVASFPRPSSISASLKQALPTVRSRELAYLAQTNPGSRALSLLRGHGLSARAIRGFEACGWALFRALSSAWRLVASSPYAEPQDHTATARLRER